MKYLNVKNLEKYHPGYKDRELSWCKIYFKMLNCDPDFEMLGEIDKWRFIALIMLQLQGKGPTPWNDGYLEKKGFELKKRSMTLTLQMLQKFVEVVTEDSTLCNLDIDKEVDKNKNKSKSGVTRFTPPNQEEVSLFFTNELKTDQITPKNFFDYFEANGWMVGRSPMANWHAAARRWDRNRHKFENSGKTDPKQDPKYARLFKRD